MKRRWNVAKKLLIFACSVLVSIHAMAQGQTISTIAGGGHPGSVATAYAAPATNSVALDASGNLYVAVTGLNQVWVVSPTGAVTEIIGSGPGGFNLIDEINVPAPVTYGGDGGPATAATFNQPQGVALDSAGNLYISDTGNNVVRKVTAATGIITTVAGSGVQGYGGDMGPALKAQMNTPLGIALDAAGNLYIADFNNNVIREVSAETGSIDTVAGDQSLPMYSYSGDGGPATAAGLNRPSGVAVDASGNLYIADTDNEVVRKVTAATGIINTYAGNGKLYFGSGLAATSSGIGFVNDVALDVFGNLYITSGGTALEVIASTGILNSLAGTNGYLQGIAVDNTGNVFVADLMDGVVREITAVTGIISTVVGNGTGGYSGDGQRATTAQLDEPFGIAVDPAGNLYIGDTYNSVVRELGADTGVIRTVAGLYTTGFMGFGDGGPATGAYLARPSGLALDSSGNLYIADTQSARIRKVASGTGIITTIAGGFIPQPGGFPEGYTGDGGPAISAQLNGPRAVAVDATGNVYIADTQNSAVRKVNTSGIITTLEAAPQLKMPTGVAVDSDGNVYVADQGNNVIRVIAPKGGTVASVAGTGALGYTGDNGPAVQAELNQPADILVASNGDLYIADQGNNAIRKVTAATGIITTVAGNGLYAFGGDGGPATNAQLANPAAIALGPGGRVYIADTYNDRVRAVPGPAVAPPPTVSPSFDGAATMPAGGTATLSFRMTNPASGQAATAVSFRSGLSPGLAVASPSGLSGSCGNVIAAEGGQTVSVSGASLSAGAACSFSIQVAAVGLGTQYGSVTDLVSDGLAANYFSLADITIKGSAEVANGASFQAGPIPPNALFSYFGPVACTPNESVLLNGTPAAILFGNSKQINFLSPGAIVGSSVAVQIACNNSPAVTLTVPTAIVNPALFTQTGTGTGQGSIVNADGTINSAAKPAAQGSYISVYGTGFGGLNAASSDGLRHIAASLMATIGGVDAPVIYAGEAPGETIGLQQINIQVPTGITSGPTVPIVLTANDTPTQVGVTVAIQ
jgi:trimeric autotransporter adhesin